VSAVLSLAFASLSSSETLAELAEDCSHLPEIKLQAVS